MEFITVATVSHVPQVTQEHNAMNTELRVKRPSFNQVCQETQASLRQYGYLYMMP